jgi:hypothetical protein
MTLTIELTPEQDQQLQAAARHEGIGTAELAQKLVTERLPSLSAQAEEQDPTLALFAQWEQEDADMTPEEIEQERLLWEEFQKDINATRQAQRMRLL